MRGALVTRQEVLRLSLPVDGEEVTFAVELDPDELVRILARKALSNKRGTSHLGGGAVVVRVVSRAAVRSVRS